VAVLNGTAWALLTPPYQVPDETGHAGYSQYIGETGKLPRRTGPSGRFQGSVSSFSEEETYLESTVRFSSEGRPSWSLSDDRALRKALARKLHRVAESGASIAVNNPPLYYVLDAIPYRLGDAANYLDRLLLMRLLSALLAGLTVALVFLFLRELLPATPWAWTVGALAVAFQPMFGFISGGVNNDNLLYAVAAALFYLLARAFRGGLTPRLGAVIGLVVAAGLLTKGNTFGLVPGVGLGVLLAAWRAPPERRRPALIGAGAAFACAIVPFGVWFVANNDLLGRSGTTTTGIAGPAAHQITLPEQLSYLWQFYLPRLPWMSHQFGPKSGFPSPSYPLWGTYFQGFVGRFGQFQYGFPLWVSELALGIFSGVIALVGVSLSRARATLRRRLPELAAYVTMVGGLLLVVGVAAYRYRQRNEAPFEQARYLLPLLALYGALIALAARGAGRRWGPAVGAFLVVLAMGHSLFAMLLTVARYYA
jgi:4-amino-4-deoxy-L-arabinose transferase-like glycosyltransferase